MNLQQERAPRILVMAGGTGGHVFPALAVANVLRERGWQVEWLGTQNGIEARVVPANSIRLHCITAVGLRGKGVAKLFVAPLHLLRAQWQSLRVFQSFRPDVVLGMGGFASGPGGLSAFLLHVPLVIHEQNAVAGTTNRALSRLARRVLSAFPAVFAGGEAVGNPVRADIAALAAETKPVSANGTPLRLLVLGGSQGAKALNALLPKALAMLPPENRPDVFHQAGGNLLDETRENYRIAGVTARIEPFIEDMASMYRWADIAVCRSGAMTVSELACAQLPALLVPFPFAIDDHQTANARWLVDAGAARLFPQSQIDAEGLAQCLRELEGDRAALQAMANAMHSLARPASAQCVADICEAVSGRVKKNCCEEKSNV